MYLKTDWVNWFVLIEQIIFTNKNIFCMFRTMFFMQTETMIKTVERNGYNNDKSKNE